MLRYDNLSSAVKKILRGQQRELTARFIAFRLRRGTVPSSARRARAMRRAAWRAKVATFGRNHWFQCRWRRILRP